MLSSHTLRFQTSESITITAEAWGSPQAPPVILLHGGGQTRHSWGYSARLIAQQGWYALTLDARGHGDSSWSPEGDYTAEHLVVDLLKVVEQLSHQHKPALVGASMGGLIALLAVGETAATICSALVLVDIAPRMEQKGIERIFAFMSANSHGFANLEEAAEAVAAYLPHRPRPADLGRLEKNLRKREDGRYYWHWDPRMLQVWQESTRNMPATTQRLMSAAKALTVPTLIVRGGISDVVSERMMSEFVNAVPQVRSVDVSGAGHMVAGDSNHAFTHAVIRFLAEVFPARS
jgi:pimeloyl-ACP methyl ester carboxylesterase